MYYIRLGYLDWFRIKKSGFVLDNMSIWFKAIQNVRINIFRIDSWSSEVFPNRNLSQNWSFNTSICLDYTNSVGSRLSKDNQNNTGICLGYPDQEKSFYEDI